MLLKLLEETRDTLDHTVVSLTEHGDLGPAVEDLGVPVRALEMSRGRPGLGALRELRGAVRRSRPDIVHGWMYHAALATVFSGFGGPTVWGIHHSISDLREESRGIRAVLRVMTLLSFHCSRILYCAESSARQHEELGFPGDKRWVIPNGFDCDTFRPDQKLRKKTRAELGLNEEPFLVGHLARFHPMKGHETFFRAAGILLERIPDAVFVLAGRNVDKSNESLAEWIRREDLGPSVLLLGQRDDVRGEVPIAFVELAEDVEEQSFDASAVRSFARESLAGYKVPREIRVVDELPRSPTGKVLRRKLSAE